MPIETLINAVKRWSLDTFPTAGGTWHTATVSLSDGGMSFVGRVPSPHNDGGDALTLTVDMSGAWAEAAEGGKLSMRFGDGSEAPVFDGKCYVPRDSMVLGGDKLTVRAVVNSGAEEVVYTEGIVGYWVAKPHASGVQVGMWSANTDTKSAFLSAVEGMKVGQEYEIGFCGLTFTDVLMQKDAKYRVLGNQNCTANGTPTEGTPYHFTITLDGNGAVTQAALFTGTAIQLQGSLPVTIRKVGETVSNILTVPLQQGEAGMFTVVEGGKVKRLADAISVGADWDAAEGVPGHIANRTHWKDLVEVSYLTNKTLTFTKNYGGEPYASLDGMPGIVEGREYTVVWGGTSYTCTAYMPSNSNIHVALGDSASKGDSDASSGTGEPFYITNEMDTDYWTFYRSSVGKVVVSVSCIEPTYHTIDVKYLPFVAASGEGEGSIILGSLYNVASGEFAFASGGGTSATGDYSSAEGVFTTASGDKSHAEGMNSVAEGSISHAEGFYTRASGLYTHAEGWETLASSHYQHVQGKYNVEDTTKTYAHIVGNGTSSKRSNAHTLDWSGNAWFAGTVLVGGTSQADAAEVATKAYVDEVLGVIENGSY